MENTQTPNISAIDLFCGVGGLTHGLEKVGIEVLAGVDFDETCEYAYEANNNADFISSDIRELNSESLIEKYWSSDDGVKVLVGCAPCQPFSTHANKIKDRESNSKWNLLNEFKRIIKETNPDIVSMENVPNLANQNIFFDFVSFLEKEKYDVSHSIVYCPDYGIPQRRKRLVLLASKLGEIKIIDPTHTKEEYVTVKKTIGYLKGNKRDKLHKSSVLGELNIKRIKASRPGGNWLDWPEDLRLACHRKPSGSSYKSVYGRMKWNDVSPTITTQFYNYGTGRFGHPKEDRAISIREGALLQTFPKDYVFFENEEDITMTMLGRHIGNAVPPKLGEIIGKSILEHLKKTDSNVS